MSSSTLARPALRMQARVWGRMAARRFESTATGNAKQAGENAKKAGEKAGESAKQAGQKASESAKQASEKTAESAKQASEQAGESAKKAGETAKDTAKDTAAKVSSTVSEYSSKAAQGLSKVTATAGPAITGALKGTAESLSKVGGPAGKIVGAIEKQTPTLVFYSKVAAELAKIVFRNQKMSPPSVSTFQTYFQNIYKTYLQNPNALLETASKAAQKATQQPANLLQQARNINRTQLVAGGVVAAEVLGFFTVGEMIGRFKIVGYHGGNPAAHH